MKGTSLAELKWRQQYSLKLFLRPHLCRRCKEFFQPWEAGKIHLCRTCDAIPYQTRRQEVNARTKAKRTKQMTKQQDGEDVRITPREQLDETRKICNSPFSSLDRSTRSGFMKYFGERGYLFETTYRLLATVDNLTKVWRAMTI